MKRIGPLAIALICAARGQGEEIDYARQIRPILSAKCFSCHGNDAEHREAELRLDVRAEAIKKRDGPAAIVPGNSGQSALAARILSDDPDKRMPRPIRTVNCPAGKSIC
ncbi:MAG: hypothetical protein N2C14_27080 [Planctomycetales bacterium]